MKYDEATHKQATERTTTLCGATKAGVKPGTFLAITSAWRMVTCEKCLALRNRVQ